MVAIADAILVLTIVRDEAAPALELHASIAGVTAAAPVLGK